MRIGFAALLVLAACDQNAVPYGKGDQPAANGMSGPDEVSTSLPVDQAVNAAGEDVAPSSAPLSCAADLGSSAAERRVRLCRDVSPATHPPCNAANSCAMIEDEIARSCALSDRQESPMAGCAPAPKSAPAAVAVVKRYYSALNARDYETAWRQWGAGGPPGQTLEKFAAGYAGTASTRVAIGALEPGDAGAGSVYQTVPVIVEATLKDGTRQRFRGSYVVRRVNDVDGATLDQLRWHIGSARLRATATP